MTHFIPLTNLISFCFVHILTFNRFLDEVQSYSGVNKMSVQNLATVFGPNILRPKVEDPLTIMEGKSMIILYPQQESYHCLFVGLNLLSKLKIGGSMVTPFIDSNGVSISHVYVLFSNKIRFLENNGFKLLVTSNFVFSNVCLTLQIEIKISGPTILSPKI